MKSRHVVRWFGLLGAIAVAACSTGGSSTGTSSSAPKGAVLRDEYEPVGPVPASGGITQITFYDATTYSLRRTMGANADEYLSVETGTYTLDLAGGKLTLSPYSGTPTTYPFQALQVTSTASTQSGSLRTKGLLGDILQGILTFIFNGQTFATDSPADTTDDAGVVWGEVEGGLNVGSDAGASGDDATIVDDATNGDGGGAETGDAGVDLGDAAVNLGDAGLDFGDADFDASFDASIGDAAVDALSCMLVPIEAGPPPSQGTSGDGVDVSHYQTGITWSTVKSSKNFAYTKATEGTHYTDSKFATNWQGMQSAGIARGAYHFFRASQNAVTQADYFASVLLAHGYSAGSDLAPMLDVEVTDGASASTVVAGVKAFLNEAQAKLGGNIIIYTGPSFWQNTLGNPNLSSHPLWIAHYTSAAKPHIPSSWPSWAIWQYSQSVQVNGIASGGVDGDRTNGSIGKTSPVDASVGPKTKVVCDGVDASSEGGSPDGSTLIPGSCTHDVCTVGDRLGQACDACTKILCANDPYCCDTYWGASCFPSVQQYCGITCQ